MIRSFNRALHINIDSLKAYVREINDAYNDLESRYSDLKLKSDSLQSQFDIQV